MVIIDPGIKVDDHYETYSNGLQMDIFIKVLYITDYNYTTCFWYSDHLWAWSLIFIGRFVYTWF